jgi:GDP-mannose 6-dehydrogenase
VSLARLTGANKAYIEEHVPHLARLMVESIDDILRHADTIVVGNGDPDFAAAINQASSKQLVVDLMRVAQTRTSGGAYQGICW